MDLNILYKNSDEIALSIDKLNVIVQNDNDIKNMSINKKALLFKKFGTLKYSKIYAFIGEIG